MAKDTNAVMTVAQSRDRRDLVTGETKPQTINTLLFQSTKQFELALQGSGEDAERFARICLSVIKNNPSLCEIAIANPLSIVAACMDIAALGLDPSVPSEIYIIPYGSEARSQVGYKGLMKLARRGAFLMGDPLTALVANEIYENDLYEREHGFCASLIHRPPPFGKERGRLIGFYAYFKSTRGIVGFEEMTVDDVKDHQKRFCKGLKNSKSPFYDGQNFVPYGLKTIMRRLIVRNLDMSNKLAAAIVSDDDDDKIETFGAPKVPIQELIEPQEQKKSALDNLLGLEELEGEKNGEKEG